MSQTLSPFSSKIPSSTESHVLVLKQNDGEKLKRKWGHPFLIKVDAQNGGAKQFSVGSEKLFPGDLIHTHKHEGLEELILICSGTGKAISEDIFIDLQPGSLVFIPQNTWHGFENTGTEPLELLWVFPQQGMEQYFRATAIAEDHPPSPLSAEELNDIRKQHRDKVEYQEHSLQHYVG